MAARIAILPGYLANSRFWDMTNAVIDTAQGTQPSLIEDASYRAAAEAITAPEGLLLQALFFNPADIVTYRKICPAMTSLGKLWPLYALHLAVLADRQEGQDQVHLIALVYPDADLAEPPQKKLPPASARSAYPDSRIPFSLTDRPRGEHIGLRKHG